jgi:hypothetical protein
MRITSIFLASLFVFNFSFACAESQRGYAKDDQGRTLVYRVQPSWWSGFGGGLLTGLGGFMTYGAWHEVNPRVKLSGLFRFSDFLSDESLENLPKFLSRMHINIPFPSINGTPAKVIKVSLGAGVTGSGMALLYSYLSNYVKLSTPLIVIDREGLQYEGKNKIFWKDVKSVRVVHETSFNWHNDTGKMKRKYALEIVDAYDKLLISENDIAITVDTLHDLIKKYCNKWW